MARGFRVGTIFGIRITIDYTWFVVFVFFAWSLAFGYFPARHPGFDRAAYVVMGVISSFLLFACVLAHELSHSYVSNRLGVRVDEITLFIFGGVAHLSGEPQDPMAELKIALAGPFASVVLAGAFWLAARLVGNAVNPLVAAILSYLAMINIVLVVFNMIPGFPLDGGRVLRAVWWRMSGNLAAATRAASAAGKGFALLLIIFGAVQILTGNIAGLWSIFIGVFLQQAAGSGYEQLLIKQALEGVKVKDLMSTDVVTIDENVSVAEAVDGYFLTHHYASFPVVSMGRPKGLLMLAPIRELPRDRWPSTRVADVMMSIDPEKMLAPDSPALDALLRMFNEGAGRLLVVEAGLLVGVISRRDIMKMMEFKAGLKG
ncbi:MAG: site-2 protease family protein [Deltaproteobacteria bacterium]|nr:site-2 protease family protein [Deltaproteobacteria bacterium]